MEDQIKKPVELIAWQQDAIVQILRRKRPSGTHITRKNGKSTMNLVSRETRNVHNG